MKDNDIHNRRLAVPVEWNKTRERPDLCIFNFKTYLQMHAHAVFISIDTKR